jgi:hypothetical protein
MGFQLDLHTLSFLFGALLIAVAVLGGGLEVKEIKVPKVGSVARLLSAIVGIFFVLIGFANGPLRETSPGKPISANTAPTLISPSTGGGTGASEAENGVFFSVYDQLGREGEAEELETAVRLFIDGKKRTEILLNSETPSQSTSVMVPEPGPHKYMIEGYTVWNITRGRRVPLHGTGSIDVQPGASFFIGYEEGALPTAAMAIWDVELASD